MVMRRPTRRLLEGVSFEQFVWDSARSFLLEDPHAPVQLWVSEEECAYGIQTFQEELATAQQRLVRLQRFTARDFLEERQAEAAAEHERQLADAEKRSKCHATSVALLDRAQKWEPPTPEHRMLKHLMLQQLRESIRETAEVTPKAELTLEVAARLHREEIVKARAAVETLEQKLFAAKERLLWRNAWVLALNLAIPQPKDVDD